MSDVCACKHKWTYVHNSYWVCYICKEAKKE